ncbi:MAG: hypothetical protein ACPG6V_10655 [Flavobacteriales bacterium]
MKTPIILENKTFYDKQKHFAQYGSVVDLAQFYFSENLASDKDFSLFVVKEAFRTFRKRNMDMFEEMDKQNNSTYYLDLKFYGEFADVNQGLDEVTFNGEEISLNTFSGNAFDLAKKEIIASPTNGLSYALLNPPYHLSLQKFIQKEAREYVKYNLKLQQNKTVVQTKFFNQFIQTIGINTEKENANIIYQWTNNWEEDLDPGKEWWGSFLWTILNKEKGEILVISASTTD